LLAITRGLPDDIQCPVADTTGRRIDHPFERRVIVTVGDQAQIGQRILDFLPLEETLTAINAIGHGALQQRLFQNTGLRVAAIENRTIT